MLSKLRQEIETIVDMELKEIQEITGTKLDALHDLLKKGDQDKPVAYYNSSNIVFTEILDYNRLKLAVKCEDAVKIEIPNFNLFIYAVNYTNCKQLKEILE